MNVLAQTVTHQSMECPEAEMPIVTTAASKTRVALTNG